MGQIKFVISMAMAVLFAIAVITFGIQFGNDNSAGDKIGDDSDFSTIQSELVGNTSTFLTDINSSSDAFFKSSLAQGDQTTATGGQFKVGVSTMMAQSSSILKAGYKKIFGSNTGFGVFLTSLSTLLLFIFTMYAYKSWIGRNPD